MKLSPRSSAVLGAFAFAVAAVPLTALALPAVSHADYCDTDVMYWNYELNQCFVIDPTPYVDPILGPVGPVGVGGLGPVAGPVGPVGVGGLGPVAGPGGPIGVGPR